MGTLFLVATPIGNLEDISMRALRILREAQLIAAEDTRQTQKLLNHFEIKTRSISYHEHNKIGRIADVLDALSHGDVALVSDAGTPGLNDPGYELVVAAVKAGYPVSPVPGPAAPIAALTGSGLATDAFLYLGYLPRRSGDRRKLLAGVAHLPYTLVFLETPHRLLDALEDLCAVLGDREAAAARELTKVHEEFVRGRLTEITNHFTRNDPRGEFTLVVSGAALAPLEWNENELLDWLRNKMAEQPTGGDLVDEAAAQSGWRKNKVYKLLVQLKQGKI
ncbi:MAG: 16S rRNA (cytidine(1402)-2'-O)-methyltransferase [Anaerolineae bacterium]|nr:16S rRNA (cytidine(1402)-2'-O)-methyltransferase [Anaerolineae bacterium]